MSKKNRNPQQNSEIPVQPAVQEPLPAAQPEAEQRDISDARIWTFWGVVSATVLAALALDAMLPNVPERVIERWLMLAFGVFMAVFLIRLK
jgi:hypothetical protein